MALGSPNDGLTLLRSHLGSGTSSANDDDTCERKKITSHLKRNTLIISIVFMKIINALLYLRWPLLKCENAEAIHLK